MARKFLTDRRGSIAVMFAAAFPVVLLLIGGTIDYGEAIHQRSRLQAAVDKAALAGARELGLANARRENVAAAVTAMVVSAIAANGSGNPVPAVDVAVTDDPLEVSVHASQASTPYFGGSFGLVPMALTVNAVARIVGRPNICVLGLDPSASGTVSLEKNARVTAQNCAVFSNSTNPTGVTSKNSAILSAALICSAGGKFGAKGNFTPDPLVDCPTFDDPLAGRPEPVVSSCDSALPNRVTSNRTLLPGTYCGGLRIDSGAEVALEPGIYVIKDGELRVSNGASLKGAGVGFYFIGNGAVATFETATTIDLAAAKAGSMSGLLFFEARQQSTRGVHQILSDNAHNLLGTIYLARGTLNVDANSPIADKSAYTAIIVRKLNLFGGPNLVLNANYELTDVPVPAGIRGVNQPVSLVK